MNTLESILDTEIRKPAQILPAFCFLIVLITLMIILPTMMGTYVNGGFKGLEPFDMPEWNTGVVITGVSCIGYLSFVLFIWIIINMVQISCQILDQLQSNHHRRKWGYDMYAHR